MLEPPLLTVRQREILPFLVAGCTRAEIAESLHLSEETVRKHVRNILELFDATNLRDGMARMVEYETCYLNGKVPFLFYCTRTEVVIDIGPDHRLARCQIEQDLLVVAEAASEFLSRLACEGEVVSHNDNDTPQTPFKKTFQDNLFRTVFDPPLKQGDVFKSKREVQLKDNFLAEHEFWHMYISMPMKSMKIRVQAPESRPFKKAWIEVEMQNALEEGHAAYFCEQERVIEHYVEEPALSATYRCWWSW